MGRPGKGMSQRHGRSSRKAEGPATQPAAKKKAPRGRDQISAKAMAVGRGRPLKQRRKEPSDDEGGDASSSVESEGEQARPAQRRQGQAGTITFTMAQFQELLQTITAQSQSGQQAHVFASKDKGVAAAMEVVERPAIKTNETPGKKVRHRQRQRQGRRAVPVVKWDPQRLRQHKVEERLEAFKQKAVAPATLAQRSSVWRDFSGFCKASGMAASPTARRVAEYVMLMTEYDHRLPAITRAVSHLEDCAAEQGLPALKSDPLIKQVLKAAAREARDAGPRHGILDGREADAALVYASSAGREAVEASRRMLRAAQRGG